MTILNEDSLAYMISGGKRDPFSTRRAFAQKLAMQGTDTSPVQSPWQGVGRLAQALAGAYGTYRADADEKQAGEDYKSELAKVIAEPDPEKRMAGLAGMGGQGALQAAITSTGQELTRKRQRDDDLQTANFMIGGPPGTQQAGGVGGGGRVASAPVEWEPHFQQASQQHGLPVPLIKAVAGTESNMDPNAVSSAGAGGVMQIMPGTAGDLGVTNRFDPGQSINKGTAYLKQQVDKYGNLPHALAAYNWGPGNVDNWLKSGGDPAKLPAETRNYIQKVQANVGGGGQQLAQGSADGSGNPLPPQNQGGDPGAQYFAAAQRAQAAGRGDIAIKFMQQATAAREAGAQRDANRTLTPREEGPDLVWYDNRTGQEVRRVAGGAKKAPVEGGAAFPGTGLDNQARSMLVRAANDPAFRASPEYRAAFGHLGRPRIDMATGMQVPPEDLTNWPQPTYSAQQQAPQGAPQQPPPGMPPQAAAMPPGMPPAPVPPPGSGPAVVAQPPQGAPPQAPPGGIVAQPIPGFAPKAVPMTGEQALAAGFTDRMANSNSLLAGLDSQGLSAWGSLNEKIPMAGNYRQTPEYRQYKQARDDFINAQLRRESGAAISDPEYDRANKQYFPQPGDDDGTIAQKAKNRALVVDAMRRNAGPGYTQNPAVGGAPSKSGADLKKKWNLE